MGGGVQRKAADSCVFGGVVWNVGHVGNNPHAHATPHFNPAGSAAKIVVKVSADSKTKRSVLAGGLVQRLLSVRPENPMAGEITPLVVPAPALRTVIVPTLLSVEPAVNTISWLIRKY